MKMYDRVYDTAFVACKEPYIETQQFPEHHIATLDVSLELLLAGVVKSITLSGRYATWYDNHGIAPWFGTESGASRDYLVEKLKSWPGLSEDQRVELMALLYVDEKAQNSIANFVCSGEDILGDMDSALVLGAKERLPRFEFLGRKLLEGVVDLDFASTGPTNDPWLNRKERFALAMQRRYLDVPNGRAGWQALKSSSYEGDILYPFWISFDAAQRAMPPAPPGTILDISEIVANMNSEGLSPGVAEFAAAAAKDPALVNQ